MKRFTLITFIILFIGLGFISYGDDNDLIIPSTWDFTKGVVWSLAKDAGKAGIPFLDMVEVLAEDKHLYSEMGDGLKYISWLNATHGMTDEEYIESWSREGPGFTFPSGEALHQLCLEMEDAGWAYGFKPRLSDPSQWTLENLKLKPKQLADLKRFYAVKQGMAALTSPNSQRHMVQKLVEHYNELARQGVITQEQKKALLGRMGDMLNGRELRPLPNPKEVKKISVTPPGSGETSSKPKETDKPKGELDVLQNKCIFCETVVFDEAYVSNPEHRHYQERIIDVPGAGEVELTCGGYRTENGRKLDPEKYFWSYGGGVRFFLADAQGNILDGQGVGTKNYWKLEVDGPCVIYAHADCAKSANVDCYTFKQMITANFTPRKEK